MLKHLRFNDFYATFLPFNKFHRKYLSYINIKLPLLALFITSCYASLASSSPWQIETEQHNALFTLHHHTLPIVTTNFKGWGDSWDWAETNIIPAESEKTPAFEAAVKKLGLNFFGNVSPNTNSSTWHYHFSASTADANAKGYGISFKLKRDSPSLEKQAKAPVLLPGNRGWRWQVSTDEIIEVQFTPALAKVYFEGDNKNEIHAMFFSAIQKGNYPFEMQLTLISKHNLTIEAHSASPKNELNDWHKQAIPWNTSPLDLSFLNAPHKPAGKHGFLQSRGEQLVFEDGSPIRFWGANLQASALFKTWDSNIKAQAKRLSRLGFNLIRIHHHDSHWVKPNIFDTSNQNTLTLNDAALRKLDWWIKCLKDEGIYIWLDLQVGRAYTHNDGIQHFDELVQSNQSPLLRGFNYYNQSIQQRIMAFNEAYLSHINPFTQLSYKDDPAIVSTLLLNENDITHHFANRLLADRNVPKHHALYRQDVEQTAIELGLNPRLAARSWEYGDAKIYLNHVEHRYHKKMLQHLKTIGVKNTMITGSSWGKMSLASLPSLTTGDMIDVHSYGRKGELLFNPNFRAGLLSWIGAAQVTNKPLSVTEWNVEKFPVNDRFTIPVWLASVASLQGWDSLMLYGYSQIPLNKRGHGSNYSTFNDPALMSMMPASALLYRQGHVSEATNTYHFRMNEKHFFGKPINPNTSAALRTLIEQSKFTIDLPYGTSLPWLMPYQTAMDNSYSVQSSHHHLVTDPDSNFIPAGQQHTLSDTSELMRNWQQGIQTINTTKSQVVSGKIGNKMINLDNVTFNITNQRAVVAVQSMDNLPLSESSKILLSKTARSQPIKEKLSAFLSEPVTGEVHIQARAGLTLYAVKEEGLSKLDTHYLNGHYKIELDSSLATPWLILAASYH